MTHPKPLISTKAQPHLSVDKLYLYLEGKLPLSKSYEVEQHLLECDLCAEALDGLAQKPRSVSEIAVFEINRQLKKRSNRPKKNNVLQDIKNWGLIAAILFLLFFSALVVWYQVNQSEPNPTPPTPPLKTVTPNPSQKLR